jgi:hypothetical protein
MEIVTGLPVNPMAGRGVEPLRGCLTNLAVKTATISAKAAGADSGQSRVSVTCVGKFYPYNRDFSRQGDQTSGFSNILLGCGTIPDGIRELTNQVHDVFRLLT